MWSVAKGQLDYSLKEACEVDLDSGVKVETWLRNKKAVLSLFAAEEHLDNAIAANGNFQEVPEDIREIVKSSLTGTCLFKNDWLACARALYIQDVNQHLFDLEHNDFDEAEIDNFKTLMSQKVAVLKSQGHRRLKWELDGTIFCQPIRVNMDDPDDEWNHRLNSRVKTILVNSGEVEPLWYEKVLFQDKSLPGVPTFLKVPSVLVEPILRARATAADLLEGVEDMGIAVKVLSKASETLVGLTYLTDLLT